MERGQTRNFDQPDEVIEVEKVRSESINIGGMSITRDIHQPGWRWSQDLKPMVGTEWCETHHLGYVLKGQLHILMKDGTEFDCRAGDLLDMP
ncbi:MAG TPA: cupin, partial [Acidimicrobiia bacterium]|nr:cupin [Acidimicrobiia bacterium]